MTAISLFWENVDLDPEPDSYVILSCMHTHTCTCTRTHTHTHTHTHTCTHSCTLSCTHSCTLSCTHTHTHTHTLMHTLMHTYTHMHAHSCTHSHTHMHTHTQALLPHNLSLVLHPLLIKHPNHSLAHLLLLLWLLNTITKGLPVPVELCTSEYISPLPSPLLLIMYYMYTHVYEKL